MDKMIEVTSSKAKDKREVVGRFAPTPSGRLHLGNIFSAMVAYLSAKSRGGKCLLRVEDLDKSRCPDSAVTLMKRRPEIGSGSDLTAKFCARTSGARFTKNTFAFL